MVASVINFIQSNNDKNILNYMINKIKENKITEMHRELDNIWSIGLKIASLILRDTICIFKLENYMRREDYYLLQPVDTWVHQISKRIGIVNRNDIYPEESKDITNKCFDMGINPIHYNQGAWYLGSQSLEIILGNIEKVL